MGKWGVFLVIICSLFAAGSIIFGIALSVGTPGMTVYFLAGGAVGFILFAAFGNIIMSQSKIAHSLENVIDILNKITKQEEKQIECKTCFKKYDSLLKACPHCGAKT